MWVRPDDKGNTSKHTLTEHSRIQNLPYIHTAHERLPFKHAGVKLDEVPSEFISKPLRKQKSVITDATSTSIKISQVSKRSRNVQSANHFQTKFLVAFMEKQKRYFSNLFQNSEHLIFPLFLKGYSLPC